ncbi:MAG: hypothetical protein IT249_16810 [Chitinophagaceae bacterium]|nr:hypothetical protein [Chitinophagaceae bacterium]
MKKLRISFFAFIILFASCSKKDSTTPQEQGTFQASINGEVLTFKVNSATLLRSIQTNEKRLDIQGTSEDGTKRLILTLGDKTSEGNGITVKTYILNAFHEDNPNTEDIDESLSTDGYTTYSTSLGSGSWLSPIFEEDGKFIVTACDATNTIISGNFETKMVNMNDETNVVTVTNGKINNIKYQVLN